MTVKQFNFPHSIKCFVVFGGLYRQREAQQQGQEQQGAAGGGNVVGNDAWLMRMRAAVEHESTSGAHGQVSQEDIDEGGWLPR